MTTSIHEKESIKLANAISEAIEAFMAETNCDVDIQARRQFYRVSDQVSFSDSAFIRVIPVEVEL